MSLPLARVLDPADLDGLRGPDGALVVTVPAAWLDEGARIRVRVPRLVTCAACDGGGCGRCGLSGALTTRERGAAEQQAELTLPRGTPNEGGACLRLPRLGGESEEEEVPRGHLLLVVRPGASADVGVVRLPGAASADDLSPAPLRTAAFALALGLLAIAGWLLSR